MPDDRVEVIESDTPAHDADVGVQRENQVASEIPPCDAHIPDNAHHTTTGNKYSVDVSPDLLQLKEESFIVLDMAELVRVLIVPLEIPVRGRSHDKVNRSVTEKGQVARIGIEQSVNSLFHVAIQARPDGPREPWQNVQEKGLPPASRNVPGSPRQLLRQ